MMMGDSPTAYEKEPEFTKALAEIPEVWDNTVALDSKVGEYVTIARNKGDEWYVAGATNAEQRTANVNFSFLPEGEYQVTLYADGKNADRLASDYAVYEAVVDNKTLYPVDMTTGGGFMMKVEKKK